MDTNKIIDGIRSAADAIRAQGATALFIYGSRARRDNRPDSDLDVLIDYDEAQAFSLLDLAGIYNSLKEHIDLEINITTRDSLHPKLRSHIEKEAIRIF